MAWNEGGERIAAELPRNGGRFPVEFVRFGTGEMGRVIGVDCDRPFSSFSLSAESLRSYAGTPELCVANMEGGAEGEGGRTDGVSDLTGDGPWPPGDLG